MSRIILYIFFFFCSFSLRGQQCFISLGDATGIEMSSSELSQLEAAACALIDSLPAEFRDSFKVFDAGFYLHHPRYDGGIPQVFEKLKAKAALESKYYLLIGGQITIEGKSEYIIDLKLPDNWLENCYSSVVINSLHVSLKSKASQLEKHFPNITGKITVATNLIGYLGDKLGSYTSCCIPDQRGISTCTDCISAFNVLDELDNLGFESYFAGNVMNSDLLEDQQCLCSESVSSLIQPNEQRSSSLVNDYAELIIEIDGEEYDFGGELSEWADLGYKAYITRNIHYCDDILFQDIQSEFNLGLGVVWIHIWENPKEDNWDVVFIKVQLPVTGDIAPEEIDIHNIQADPPPPFKYRIVHRCFAPWDRFGHLPVFPGVHIAKNSFEGDNRGFSLNEPHRYYGTTARIQQQMKIELGKEKKQIIGYENLFSSITRGYKNFKQKKPARRVPHPYKEHLDYWEYESNDESEGFGSAKGFEKSMVQNRITYTSMFFEGSNPLVVVAPNIEWYLELDWYYKKSNNSINISGMVIGKSFPAYEAFVEDNSGNKVFIYTYTSPCESDLAIELMNPFPNYNKDFDISLIVSSEGCFTGSVTTVYDSITTQTNIQDWNQANLSKPPAKDCPTIPCQGAYPNNGTDKTSDYDCGN